LVNRALSTSWIPIETDVRAALEPEFGHDFASVRVHTDATAAASARAVGSLAYTIGRHVVFAPGQYAPRTTQGRALLTHELTHVLQHGGSAESDRPSGSPEIGERGAPEEKEAEAVAAGLSDPGRIRTEGSARSGFEAVLRRATDHGSTNWAFDTGHLTEAHLQDPDVVARLNALSRIDLIRYRRLVADPVVQTYIDNLLAHLPPSPPCSPAEISRLNTQVEDARTAVHGFVGVARRGLDRLHSAWIDNKSALLAGPATLEGTPVCAFNSNFNISARSPDYGVRQIGVMNRLRQLDSVTSKASTYSCRPEDDPVCVGTDQDTIAYVRGNHPPIHFCADFRAEPDVISQQATVAHEFAHFLPGVRDQGGYALGGFGAQVMTCLTNFKFKAASDVLTNTADALAGFVINVGDSGATDVRVH
jgi:hypothetical protein